MPLKKKEQDRKLYILNPCSLQKRWNELRDIFTDFRSIKSTTPSSKYGTITVYAFSSLWTLLNFRISHMRIHVNPNSQTTHGESILDAFFLLHDEHYLIREKAWFTFHFEQTNKHQLSYTTLITENEKFSSHLLLLKRATSDVPCSLLTSNMWHLFCH